MKVWLYRFISIGMGFLYASILKTPTSALSSKIALGGLIIIICCLFGYDIVKQEVAK